MVPTIEALQNGHLRLSTPLRMCQRVGQFGEHLTAELDEDIFEAGREMVTRWSWPSWRLKPRLGDLGSIRIGKVSCGLWVPSCAKLRLGASHWLLRQVYRRPFEASKCSGFRQLKLVKVHFWPESLTIFWGWKDQAASFKLSLRPTFWGNSSNSLDVTALSTSQSSQTMIIGHSTAQGAPRCWRPTVRTLWGHEDFLKKGVIRFLSDSAGRSGCHWLSPATCGLVVISKWLDQEWPSSTEVLSIVKPSGTGAYCLAWCLQLTAASFNSEMPRNQPAMAAPLCSIGGWGAEVESDSKSYKKSSTSLPLVVS